MDEKITCNLKEDFIKKIEAGKIYIPDILNLIEDGYLPREYQQDFINVANAKTQKDLQKLSLFLRELSHTTVMEGLEYELNAIAISNLVKYFEKVYGGANEQ